MTDYGHELEFGVFITPAAEAFDSVIALTTLADRSGLDLVTFQDHPYQTRFLDTWTLLSYLAARTTIVRLAPNVLNLPLRQPAVVARSVASLDILSGGRAELGIGAGAFWEAIEKMGGTRLTGRQSVDALGEAIDVIRALWDVDGSGPATVSGSYHRLQKAGRGPKPVHDIGIWVGAYKPRMLDLVGRKADGWLPSLSYLKPGDLAAGNEAIDEAAEDEGRDPSEIRRLLNVSGSFEGSADGLLEGPPESWIEELSALALEDGIGTFILMTDDANLMQTFAAEVVPAVRERVAEERDRGGPGGVSEGDIGRVESDADEPALATGPDGDLASAGASTPDGLGITPTPDDGKRLTDTPPWDESTRPHRKPTDGEVTYTERGRMVGRHLIEVHDMLRTELGELRDLVAKVRQGALTAGAARSSLNDMALRQNNWTLGAFCSRYCNIVGQHHGAEDFAVFPHLVSSDPDLEQVIQRLTDEHLAIHDAIQKVDAALIEHINHPDDFDALQTAIDFLADALLSHLSYEEHEIVEPLARHGFYEGQMDRS